MYEPTINGGVIFNQFPKLLAIATKACASDSDALVKLARIHKNDQSITHDHQLFRNYRSGETSLDELASYFGDEFNSLLDAIKDDLGESKVGGWVQFKYLVMGMRRGLRDDESLANYFDFLVAHAEVERRFYDENTPDNLSQYVNEWLRVGDVNFLDKTSPQLVNYIVNMVMYWASLFELFLEVYYESSDYCNYNTILPKIIEVKKGIKFSSSMEQLLLQVNQRWAQFNYGKEKLFWTQLYKDILCKQMEEPWLRDSMEGIGDWSHVDPDTTAVKKRFQRWRKKELMSVYDFRKYIAILFTPLAETKDMLQCDSIIFINVFTFVQNEMLKANVPHEDIVHAFQIYPDIKKLVRNRYDHFLNAGTLKPNCD